jgi:hypothetical protein
MDSALIVTPSEKSAAQLRELLTDIPRIAVANTVGETRRLLTSSEFELFVINSPLSDGAGDDLARRLA